MPMPTRRKGENHDQFMSRCMGDEMMVRDFKDEKQRAAVCYSQARKHMMPEASESPELPAKIEMSATITFEEGSEHE